jgi:uncharacterized protein
MKFAAFIEDNRDEEQIKATFTAHRQYLRTFLESGQLLAAGPFTDNGGALNIDEAESLDQVEGWLRGDPFHAAGVTVKWRIPPLAYWSPKAAGPGKKVEAAIRTVRPPSLRSSPRAPWHAPDRARNHAHLR